MASSKKIKTRINSIQSTHKITKAMEIVSTTKFRRYSKLARESQPYSDSIHTILTNISAGIKAEHQPLFDGRAEVKRIALIVITSDRGLCGSFNSNTLKAMEAFRKEHGRASIEIISLGRKVRDYCEKRRYPVMESHTGIDKDTILEVADQVGEAIVTAYEKKSVDAVYVIYNKFISALASELKTEQVIPIPKKKNIENKSYLFEPSAEEVLSALLPKYIGVSIYQAILNNMASEHSSRKNAMTNANENAEDMIRKLELKYNRERQAAITQEITEIVGGAEAL